MPSPPGNTTGANDTSIPCAAATARVVNRNSSSRSAASSGLDGAIDTSNWPGEYSGWTCSTGTSTASSASARSRAKSDTAINDRTL